MAARFKPREPAWVGGLPLERGGGGNFGVVTSLEFRVHPVGDIVGGPIFFELAAAADVMAFYRQYIAQAPEDSARSSRSRSLHRCPSSRRSGTATRCARS